VLSGSAQRIELCLFDARGDHEIRRIELPGRTQDVWHGYLPHARPGQVYGFRAHGPWRPDRGQVFDPAKLLLDPWAREVVGQFIWHDEQFGADRRFPLNRDGRDNTAYALKSRVVADDFDWGGDRAPHTPLDQTVLYELHVKGFSRLQAAVPDALRGTFAGLAHPASVAHLRQLGVTAVSLMPVHYAIDEERLVQMGLHNYWGYNPIAFFCPDPALASVADGRGVRDEFRQMVRSAAPRPASKCSSMSSTTTRPRATRTARRSASVAWTTHRLLPAERHAGALRSTTPAAATRWTSAAAQVLQPGDGQPALLGAPRCMSTASASTWRRCWAGATMASTASGAFFKPPSRRTRCCPP
jgi:hypothetical protein